MNRIVCVETWKKDVTISARLFPSFRNHVYLGAFQVGDLLYGPSGYLFSYACPRVSGSGSYDGHLPDAPPPSEIASLKKGSTLPRKSLNLGLIQPLFRWGHVEQSWCILHHDHWQTCSEHPCNSRAARFFGVSWPCQTTRMTSSGLPKNSMTQHGATFQHPTLHSHHPHLLGTMHTKGRKGTGTRDLVVLTPTIVIPPTWRSCSHLSSFACLRFLFVSKCWVQFFVRSF